MFAKRRRFTLLLLEDEEYYVEDWVASCCWPRGVEGNWQGLDRLTGRLRLCTRSLFFEPDDARLPIVRFPFSAVTELEASASNNSSFVLASTHLVKMKENVEDVPYKVEKGKSSSWKFTLTYAQLDSFMPLAQEQLVASRLPQLERMQLVDELVRAREDAVQFDSSRLVDFRERLCWEGPVVGITPLVREPGRLAITDQRVYFQPLHNITGDAPVKSHSLAAVAAVVRRRCSLRPYGLELFFVDPASISTSQAGPDGSAQAATGAPASSLDGLEGKVLPSGRSSTHGGPVWQAASAFFAFRTEAARDQALVVITSQQLLGSAVANLAPVASSSAGTSSKDNTSEACSSSYGGAVLREVASHVLEAEGQWLWRVTGAWRQGKVSNFDYLMYLNLAAGRSFNDLAQWPVFPWVLADYKSSNLDLKSETTFRDLARPMGAQTEARLDEFRHRYREMCSMAKDPDMAGAGGMPEPFMYGTHYSTPGYVMFWLVRAAPGHMLRLQSGKFDQPDRLFHSISESWESATSSSTDVKELIPEFFMPGGDFLVNGAQLPLGKRQTGEPVQHVKLPPWANSPAHFLAVHRAALEAPYVSQHLHEWVDLIFGYKQQGPAAVEADNVFYHLTYEGAVDISKITSMVELKALETQINEFGQAPRQLFHRPHPPREVLPEAPDPTTVFSLPGEAPKHLPGSSPAPAAAGAGGSVLPPNGAARPGVGVSSNSSSTASTKLRGGGEDAAGGAVVLALLHSILASVAQEEQEEAGDKAPLGSSSSSRGVLVPEANRGSRGRADSPDPGRLSPPIDSDFMSAAPLSLRGREAATGTAPAAAAGALGAKGGSSQSLSARGAQLGSRMLAGVSSSWSFGRSTPAADAALQSPSGSSSSSNMAGKPLPAASAPAGQADSAGAGKGSLSWVQQQLFRGLQVSTAAGLSAAAGPGGFGGTAPAPAPAPGSTPPAPSASLSGGLGGSTVSPPEASPSASRAAREQQWPPGLAQHLLISSSSRLQREPLTALAAPQVLGLADAHPMVACVGCAGLLRVLQLPQLDLYRSAKLPEDLLSLAVLPGPSVPSSTTSNSLAPEGPTLVTGSSAGQVLALSVPAGKVLGSYAAHGDAVPCVSCLGPDCRQLLTASWDCSIKVWELAEGRQPWDSTLPLPVSQLHDLDSGVWAAAAAPSGQLLVAGTEEGLVVAWDLRTKSLVWSTKVSEDYIGGLTWVPGGSYLGVAAADGGLSLLEWRREGQPLVQVECGAPLRCCVGDEQLMIAGSEAGQLQLWDIGQMTGKAAGARGALGGPHTSPDGLYAPLACESKAAVNALCVVPGAGDKWQLFVAQEDGMLAQFST